MKRRILLLIMTVTLIFSVCIPQLLAVAPEQVQPLWDNVNDMSADISFVGDRGYYTATIQGISGTSNITAVAKLYYKNNSGKWIGIPMNWTFSESSDYLSIEETFSVTSGTEYKVDKYTGYFDYNNGFINPNLETIIHSESHSYASASSSGVTWYADLVGHISNYAIESIYGHGEFLLRPKAPSFTTTLYGHYVHAKTVFTLSLGIPDYGFGFTVSGGSSYDEIGNQITYTY